MLAVEITMSAWAGQQVADHRADALCKAHAPVHAARLQQGGGEVPALHARTAKVSLLGLPRESGSTQFLQGACRHDGYTNNA